MPELLTPDICVIGAGSGGLSVAAAAAAFGVSVVLIEDAAMGGECLNTGCVPSKSLIAAARNAKLVQEAGRFGIAMGVRRIGFQKVHDRIHRVIAEIAPTDSIERFRAIGVNVIEGWARFVDRRTVLVGEQKVRARRFVVATGSKPVIPMIPGLADAPFHTNETIFSLTEVPGHLAVLGGGPIGLELAQAFARLGAQVSVVEAAEPLGREDRELAAIVLDGLARDGVSLYRGASVTGVERSDGGVRLVLGGGRIVEASDLLVAAGRQPRVRGMGLERARIVYDSTGIHVDSRLRTTNPRVYAIGDASGAPAFTHVANYQAGIVLRNVVFRLGARASYHLIPRVTYTDPELAQVGLTEAEAGSRYGRLRVLRWPFAENDRARLEGETAGHVKVIATKRGRILGAGIVGAQAGELIQIWGLALARKLRVRDMVALIPPYPTLGEISRRAAIEFYRSDLTRLSVRRIIATLRMFG